MKKQTKTRLGVDPARHTSVVGFEPLEGRRYLSSLLPKTPDKAPDPNLGGGYAGYLTGHTYFVWKDLGSPSNGYDPAVTCVIESSPDGNGNWTPYLQGDVAAAKQLSVQFQHEGGSATTWRTIGARHDRQKFYRMHVVDADGDMSPPTQTFQAYGHPEESAIQASAIAQPSGSIALLWRAKSSLTYNVSRRNFGSTSLFASLNTSPISPSGASGTFVDSTAVPGSAYEYRIRSSTFLTTYLAAGFELAAVEGRGKIVLLVDDAVAGALRGYIARLQSDLVGDGWTVLRHNVYRTQSVAAVKQIIKDDYDSHTSPNGGVSEVKQVLLIGHVPVPYSGSIAEDGHGDHTGAWATDAYYADMTGVWTDQSVNTANNTPDDGRFDQNVLSGAYAPEVAVGRIDMNDMPLAGVTEVELLKRYLRKDHEYRVGAWDVRKRAILYSNWLASPGYIGGPLQAYTNLSPLVGSDQINTGYYFQPNQNHLTSTTNNSYIWGWADGSGADDFTQFVGGYGFTSDGGGAAQFLSDATSPDVVFNQLYGSYFPDWDRQNNFLRAAIAGPGYGLTSTSALGAGVNFWHMGMGETIGDNFLFTQQSRLDGGAVRRSTALMGDPTLRTAVVKPPADVRATVEDEAHSTVSLAWTASADSEVLGYQVYRAASVDGPFVKISGTGYVSATTPFVDTAAFAGCVYMVRAIKLEQANTGTYYNLSQGAFSEAQTGLAVGQGRASRAYVGSVALTFNRPVTLGPGAVIVDRRDLPPGPGNVAVSVSSDDGGLSYDVRLLDAQNNVIPFDNGVYDVQVVPDQVWLAGTTTPIHQTTQAGTSYAFFRLMGDADGDASVDFDDYVLYQTEVQVDQTLASDSDGDGDVDYDDFVLLQTNFGVTFSV